MESPRNRALFHSRLILALAWICIAAMLCMYGYRVARIGVDLREDFWVYWQNNRFYGDLNTALHHGQHVLREATEIEQADQASSTDHSLPTIARPGQGLFDSPKNLSIILHRWHLLRPVYGHIFRGWIATYDHLVRDRSDGEYQMDYPPLRSLVMTLWTWKIQSEFPSIRQFPTEPIVLVNPYTHQRQLLTPDVVHPMLMCNMTMEAISSIAMFFLVWIWVRRDGHSLPRPPDWRLQWGDPLLLVPAIVLGVFTILRSKFNFQLADFPASPTLIDERFGSIGWWFFLLLRFISAVSLARILPLQFRAIACGVVAATITWLNPATILESFGWPQWEAWLPPFFLVAAVLISIDWWLTAGLVLGLGCMFKGQLLLLSPLLILCPLLAGYMGRFMRITAGFAAGFGLLIWPWLVRNSRADAYITAAIVAAALICIASVFRVPLWRAIRQIGLIVHSHVHSRLRGTLLVPFDQNPLNELHWLQWIALALALSIAAVLSLLIYRNQDPSLHKWTLFLTLGILTMPWFIPRKQLAAWVTLVFAAALWLSAFSLNGSFSWWSVGFMYGTQKHQQMQLGNVSLSNLSSLLERRYGWSLHDPVGTWRVPFITTPIELDIQSGSAVLFEMSLLLCTIAAAVHLRRNDKKFLVALVAPWMLFVTLLTQMAGRYTVFPATVAAALVGVSVGMSLIQVLLTTLSFAMVSNQLLGTFPQIAPKMYAITSRTFPDIGWLMLLLAGVLFVSAMIPSRRNSPENLSP